jgi:dTDP-glucose 4,6-dehydratase
MSEDVMDRHEIRQLNDYAISKWVNEQQVLNSASMFGTQSVRVRLFNTYGPGELYSKYRSVVCMFAYRALHNLPYTVYTGHKRTSTYITDMARTLANIADNFVSGDYHDIKSVSDLVLQYTGGNDKLVTYKDAEPHTTAVKKVDCSKAVRDLAHTPTVALDEGIRLTVDWMRSVYHQMDSTPRLPTFARDLLIAT